jgi:uncharacterized Zn finger protein (UPF0148 family)
MPYLQRQEMPPGPVRVPAAGVDLLGDLVCPNCGALIVTPWGFDVVPGWGRCPACQRRFKVTRRTAEAANGRIARTDARSALAFERSLARRAVGGG